MHMLSIVKGSGIFTMYKRVFLYTDSKIHWDFGFIFFRFSGSYWTGTNPGRNQDRRSVSEYSGWIKFLGLGVHPF